MYIAVGTKPERVSSVLRSHDSSGTWIQCCGQRVEVHACLCVNASVCVCVRPCMCGHTCAGMGVLGTKERVSANDYRQRARSTPEGIPWKVPAIMKVPFTRSSTMIPMGSLPKPMEVSCSLAVLNMTATASSQGCGPRDATLASLALYSRSVQLSLTLTSGTKSIEAVLS